MDAARVTARHAAAHPQPTVKRKHAATPRVSVIVPSHGHRRFLPERLASITAQTRAPDELIIVDDGSTDGSAEWLQSWHSPLPLQLECRPTSSGNPFATWNIGAARATGDWLWIAESDDACRPGLLETLLQVAQQQPEAAIVFCQSELIDPDSKVLGTFAQYTDVYDSESWRSDFALEGPVAVARHLLARNTIPNVSACLLSRAAWNAAGGAELSLDLCGDWMTYGRLLRHGSLGFVAAPLNQHRHHPATQRSRTTRMEYVRQSYLARRHLATLHHIPSANCEFARRFAWGEAADVLRTDRATLGHVLDSGAQDAAREFDSEYEQRGSRSTWDHCDVFFDSNGAFSPAKQRRLPVEQYDNWKTYTYRALTGQVRFDPLARAGRCELKRVVAIEPKTGRTVWGADARSHFTGVTANPGVDLQARDGSLFIVSAHDDPQLSLPPAVGAGRAPFDLTFEMRHTTE